VYNRVQCGVYIGVYIGAYNEVHLADRIQVGCMQRDV
jgi:hypothetical protein